MTNIQIANQASKLMKAWEKGNTGFKFFLDFWKNETGNEVDSKEYELVYDLINMDMV